MSKSEVFVLKRDDAASGRPTNKEKHGDVATRLSRKSWIFLRSQNG